MSQAMHHLPAPADCSEQPVSNLHPATILLAGSMQPGSPLQALQTPAVGGQQHLPLQQLPMLASSVTLIS